MAKHIIHKRTGGILELQSAEVMEVFEEQEQLIRHQGELIYKLNGLLRGMWEARGDYEREKAWDAIEHHFTANGTGDLPKG